MQRNQASKVVLAGLVTALVVGLWALIPAPAGVPGIASAKPEFELCDDSNVAFVGQSEALNKTLFGGVAVGELSGITYDIDRDAYYTNADRVGAAVPSRVFTVDLPLGMAGLGTPAITSVVELKKADGTMSNGSDFDGEGIAFANEDTLFIASEGRSAGTPPAALFQSSIRHYALDGSLLETLAVPSRFLVAPDGQGVSNLTFESMALSRNGRSLFTAVETPLAADGATEDRRGRIRILRYEDRGPGGFVPAEEYFYLMDPARNPTGPLEVGVVELIALSEDDLLVLERGFVMGQGNTVRIFRVSLDDAEDVSDEASLAAPDLKPLEKKLVVDLEDCPSGGATSPAGAIQPNPILDNFEGMTLGPVLPGGLRALILVSDDNLAAVQTTRIVVLALPQSVLHGDKR
jgi:hypothetical protein